MSFTYNLVEQLSTNDGINLSRTVSSAPAAAKVLIDDSFTNPDVIDVTTAIASIADPKAVIVLADGDGVKLKFDGAASFTAKAYKSLALQITPNTPGPTGVLDLTLEAQGAAQRVRVLVVGD